MKLIYKCIYNVVKLNIKKKNFLEAQEAYLKQQNKEKERMIKFRNEVIIQCIINYNYLNFL